MAQARRNKRWYEAEIVDVLRKLQSDPGHLPTLIWRRRLMNNLIEILCGETIEEINPLQVKKWYFDLYGSQSNAQVLDCIESCGADDDLIGAISYPENRTDVI